MAASAQRDLAKLATTAKRPLIGRAVWWIPKPKTDADADVLPASVALRDEEQITQKLSFAADLKDLLQNLSFHCYGRLVEHSRCKQERFFWLIFHITALSVLIASVWHMYKDAREALVTTIHNPMYPICMVDLPAISVCNMNRISKRAVWRYAHELSEKDPKKRNATFFYGELHTFGMYYSPEELGDYERVLRFQGFLDVTDTMPNELFFNPRIRMRQLTPNCSEMLLACRIGGKSVECLELFHESLTQYGFCCTFNWNGEYPKSDQQCFFGHEMGLVVTLRSMPNDYFFKKHQLNGFASGSVAIRYVQSGLTTYLPVVPKIFETVPEARHMRPAVRKCLFENEIKHNFTRRYTFSNCISACRARSMFRLCRCLPFTMPMHYIAGTAGLVFCTLQHMECLRRYKFKWLNVITSRAQLPGLEHELEDALYCPDCLPSCTEIRYHVRGAMTLALNTLYTPINNSNSNSDANNSYNHDNSELALVRIYFAETHIQYFRQIIKNAWYEIFSTIGNICGIIAGFSLIGICELLFFLAKQLWHAYKAELKSEQNESQYHSHSQSQSQSQSRIQALARANGRAKATQQLQKEEEQPMELLILP